jgi:hypothetical protein
MKWDKGKLHNTKSQATMQILLSIPNLQYRGTVKSELICNIAVSQN